MSDSTFIILFFLLFALAFASLVLIKPLEQRFEKGLNAGRGPDKESEEA